MNSAMVNSYRDDYQTLAPVLPGRNLPWLATMRSEALAHFSEHGFPSPREEEWRYTNVSAIEKKRFAPQAGRGAVAIDPAWLERYRLPDAWSVVLVDGHFSPELSNLEGVPESMTVMSMAAALQKHPEWVRPYLGQAVGLEEHGFIAFNTAWFSDGLMVKIPAWERAAKPIQLLHVVTGADGLAATRNLIVVEQGAEVQVIETFAGLDEAYLAAAVTEAFVGPNAGLTLYKMQCESAKAYHFGGLYVKQSRDARFVHHNFAFGGLLARSDIHTDLDQASECELNGLYLGVKRQHIDNHTRINHLQPYASSREIYKGVLDDRARGVFQGRVIVAENAQKTDSQMNNRNILLSEDAEADTKPQLEIYADDVKCGHGVTVGQLDEKSVYYLQSRCIDEETARNMLTFAFANEMVGKIKIDSLHDQVLAQVLERFPQEGVHKEWL
ncbi:MAG: Fe-S cluster assembly protein SufD [Methylosarcina sp.]